MAAGEEAAAGESGVTVLSPIEAHRVVSVLDETLEKLAFLDRYERLSNRHALPRAQHWPVPGFGSARCFTR